MSNNINTEPYLLRPSEGKYRLNNEIIGGTLAWNQLVQNGNFADDSVWSNTTPATYTMSVANNILSCTLKSVNNYAEFRQTLATKQDHKYLISIGKVTTPHTIESLYFALSTGATINSIRFYGVTTGGYASIVSATAAYNNMFLRSYVNSGEFAVDEVITFENIQVFDLTAMFGPTIADYIYTTEQATAGAGIALAKKWANITKDYYPYDAGSLKHVSGLVSHDMVGFNQWDGTYEDNGYYSQNGTFTPYSGYGAPTIKVIPGKTYYYRTTSSATGTPITCWRDADGNALDIGLKLQRNGTVVAPANAHYMNFALNKTEIPDVCINISDPDKNGTYEPYVKNSYPLDSSLTLRGIPKLNEDNNLYYDGDIYSADGSVERRYRDVLIDGGTNGMAFNDSFGATTNGFAVYINLGLGERRPNVISDKFTFSNVSYSSMPLYSFVGGSGANVTWTFILPSTVTSTAEANAWAAQNPFHILIPLSTPTTESALPYSKSQIVDGWGTEEYVISSSVTNPIKVGHTTTYLESNDSGEVGDERLAYLDKGGLVHFWDRIKNKFAKGNAGLYYGTCDSAADAVVKEVECENFSSLDLVKGTVISVFFSATNSAAVASLQLNVNNTGAKNIKYIYNGAISNIPGANYIRENQIYQFTYDGTYWVVQMIYNTNSDTVYVLYYTNPTAGPGGIMAYSLFMQTADYTYSSLVATSGTGTSKTKNSIGFKPGKLLYHWSSTSKTAGSSVGNNCVKESGSLIDLRYSGNQGSTLVAKKPVYVVGTINEDDGLFYLDNNWISQTVPTTEDGKVYIYIGLAYNTYQCDLDAYNPMYRFIRGAFRLYYDVIDTVETTYQEIDMIVNS